MTAVRTGKSVIKAISKADKKVFAQCVVKVILNDTNKLKYDLLDFRVGYKNKVVKSYEELQEYIRAVEDISAKNNYDPARIKQKLKSYDEDYFKSNVLYLKQYTHGYGEWLYIDKVERIRKSSGKYLMRITITNEIPEESIHYPSICCGYLVVVEASKEYAEMVNSVQCVFVPQKRQ